MMSMQKYAVMPLSPAMDAAFADKGTNSKYSC